MQFSYALAILAFAATAVVATPVANNPPTKPNQPTKPNKPTKPQPPVVNNQVNTCSSGSPFCCSPSDTYGTTCVRSSTSCNTISICCNNFANQAEAIQSCAGSVFPGGVYFPGYPIY